MGEKMFIMCMIGWWELVQDVDHDVVHAQQDACKFQGSDGVGIWWIKNKMKMLHEELQFNKAKVYTFVLNCKKFH